MGAEELTKRRQSLGQRRLGPACGRTLLLDRTLDCRDRIFPKPRAHQLLAGRLLHLEAGADRSRTLQRLLDQQHPGDRERERQRACYGQF